MRKTVVCDPALCPAAVQLPLQRGRTKLFPRYLWCRPLYGHDSVHADHDQCLGSMTVSINSDAIFGGTDCFRGYYRRKKLLQRISPVGFGRACIYLPVLQYSKEWYGCRLKRGVCHMEQGKHGQRAADAG